MSRPLSVNHSSPVRGPSRSRRCCGRRARTPRSRCRRARCARSGRSGRRRARTRCRARPPARRASRRGRSAMNFQPWCARPGKRSVTTTGSGGSRRRALDAVVAQDAVDLAPRTARRPGRPRRWARSGRWRSGSLRVSPQGGAAAPTGCLLRWGPHVDDALLAQRQRAGAGHFGVDLDGEPRWQLDPLQRQVGGAGGSSRDRASTARIRAKVAGMKGSGLRGRPDQLLVTAAAVILAPIEARARLRRGSKSA